MFGNINNTYRGMGKHGMVGWMHRIWIHRRQEQTSNKEKAKSIVDMNEGEEGIISEIHCGINCMQQVKNLGINIGEKIKVINKPQIGPMTIEVNQRKVLIEIGMASKIYVKKE